MDLSLLNFDTPPDVINRAIDQSLVGNLGIEITATGDGFVEGFMQLSEKNCRPDGILHGGANLAMAETLAGLGSMLIIDMKEYNSFGIQVSGNHIGILSEGKALGEANIIHRGNMTLIWNVDIKNEEGRFLSSIRVTNMIVKRNA